MIAQIIQGIVLTALLIGFLVSAFFVFFGVACDNPPRAWGCGIGGCIVSGMLLMYAMPS